MSKHERKLAMSFYVVIEWNPADEVPFETKFHISKPLATKREAWRYVQRVQERAKLSGIQLHDIAVFTSKPANPSGVDVDHENQRVYDHARWRLHGRNVSYRAMFC